MFEKKNTEQKPEPEKTENFLFRPDKAETLAKSIIALRAQKVTIGGQKLLKRPSDNYNSGQ